MSSSPSSATTALHQHNHVSHHKSNLNQSSPTKTKMNATAPSTNNSSSCLDVENANNQEDRANKRMRISDSIDNLNNCSNANTTSNGNATANGSNAINAAPMVVEQNEPVYEVIFNKKLLVLVVKIIKIFAFLSLCKFYLFISKII